MVAGTAHSTFIATGLVGSAAYVHSGEMRTGGGRVMAIILSLSSVVGALIGAYVNSFVPRSVFGVLLGVLAMATGITIVYRERRQLSPLYELDVTEPRAQSLGERWIERAQSGIVMTTVAMVRTELMRAVLWFRPQTLSRRARQPSFCSSRSG